MAFNIRIVVKSRPFLIQSSTFSLVIAYTFLFSEEVNIDKDNLADFMDDLFLTVHLFNTGEYKPEDYAEQMKEQGIDIYDIIERRKEKENILEDK